MQVKRRHTGWMNFTKAGKIISTLILYACFFVANCKAQNTLPFQNFTVNEGLPSSEVYHVMQDSKGFMWFSTDHGVCRFDGYQFKSFTTANGLADNTIFEATEDYKGRIWFRSYSGRLSYYYNDSIFSLPENDKLVTMLHRSLITSLGVDDSEYLYIATQFIPGVIKLDLKHKDKIEFISLPRRTAYIFRIPGTNQPLIGSTINKYESDMDTSSLLSVHAVFNKGSFYYLPFEFPRIRFVQAVKLPGGKTAFSHDRELDILQDNKIIFSTVFNSAITKLSFDKSGKIWIALQDDEPVYCYNEQIFKVAIMHSLKDKQITSVAIDNEGGLWLTSRTNGIYYLSSLNFETRTMENGLPGNKINLLVQAPDSSLWIAPSPGNVITVLKKDSISYHTISDFNNSTTLNFILFNKDKTVWISSGKTLRAYNNPDDFILLKTKTTYWAGEKDLLQNKDGSVWANCTGDARLFSRTEDSMKVLKVVNPKAVIKKLLLDSNNNLWIATMAGLWEYTNSSLVYFGTKYSVLKKRIDDIKLSSNGDLWMATRDTGLIFINKGQLRFINSSNGLISNFSHCISFDYKGNLWVGTNMGISHIIMHYTNKGICSIDSIKNIAVPNLKEINCIVPIKNMVYAGTNNGLVSFDMDKIGINKTPPPIYITGLSINNAATSLGLQKHYLSYDENNIVINYVGLTYRDHSDVLYRYKMEGVDTGYSYTKYTVVQYPKLPPGEYSFLVSVRNSDGVWSKSDATVSFIIAPPFWVLWWVKLLASVLIIAIIIWRITGILKRERLKAEAGQKLIEMQLRELREQMDPHFLFNNLNTLSYLVESKSPDAPVFVDELSKYFRYSLQFRNMEFTELKNELLQAERYIHLLRIRYGDKLIVRWDINENLSGYFISNHSLQLLLENIIKHNLVSEESPLYIEIKTTDANTLVVKNNLQPKIGVEESTGLGLKSIDERYHLLYKRNIKISRTSDSFIVELPLLTPNEYESTNY